MLIEVGGKPLVVEVADSPSQWQKGLMGRTELPDGAGMLFIYPDSRPRNFWMRNTSIPLSIGFFDSEGNLFAMLDMAPYTQDQTLYSSGDAAQFALEVPQGWFERNEITLGSRLSMEYHLTP